MAGLRRRILLRKFYGLSIFNLFLFQFSLFAFIFTLLLRVLSGICVIIMHIIEILSKCFGFFFSLKDFDKKNIISGK